MDFQSQEDFTKELEELEKHGGPFKIIAFNECACCHDVHFFFMKMDMVPLILIRPVFSRKEAADLLEYFHNKKLSPISDKMYGFYGSCVAAATLAETPPGETVQDHLRESHQKNPAVAQDFATMAALIGQRTNQFRDPKTIN